MIPALELGCCFEGVTKGSLIFGCCMRSVLKLQGFEVLRFRDTDVLRNMEGVLERIVQILTR